MACRSGALVRLAEAAAEEEVPAGGMVLRQADRARVVHFLLAAATAPAEHAARLGARADQVALDRLIE